MNDQKKKEQIEKEWFDYCIKNELSYYKFLKGSHLPEQNIDERMNFLRKLGSDSQPNQA